MEDETITIKKSEFTEKLSHNNSDYPIWRDLTLGECLLPGDRIIQDGKWHIWTEQDSNRNVFVTKNSFPCQRPCEWHIDLK